MRVLGVSGSLRRDSINSALLRAAAERLPADAELELFTGLADIPPYNEDADAGAGPAAVASLRDAVRDADAVLIATPEYNSSIPGQLKNALDWVSRPAGASVLAGVPVAVIGASTGMFGAVWAQAETRKVAKAIGAKVVDAELAVGYAGDKAREDGRLQLDEELGERLAEILAELTALVAAGSGVHTGLLAA